MVSDNPLVAEQIAPLPNVNPAVWPLVIADMHLFGTDGFGPQVIADMQDRDLAGRKKYGTPLQPHNGRDALVDLYQELLDAAVYAKQAMFEGIDIEREYVRVLESILEVRERIEMRRSS